MKRAFISYLRRLFSKVPQNPLAMAMHRNLLGYARGLPRGRDRPALIAVQGVEDPLYYGLLGSLAIDLIRRSNASARFLLVRSINGAVGRDLRTACYRSTPWTFIATSRWARLQNEAVGPPAYRSKSFDSPLGDVADLARALLVWRKLRSAEDCENLRLIGMHVGDLIVDSYIRFRPSPVFRHTDPWVASLIWQAFRDIRRARGYFSRHRPSVYLTSYSTYLEHGIAVRAALEYDCAVYSFGSLSVFGKRLKRNDTFHTPDTTGYKEKFDSLDNQEERRSKAESALADRLAGRIDAATSYMRHSAYRRGTDPTPEVDGAVVVFLHDFYDSPHVYGDLVFPDFWRWACFTIETLRAANIPFWLKPHPNQINLSTTALRELTAAYPGVQLVPPGVTNVQLAERGMACGVTVYGTVAHELAYLGIPSIACARHPHISFGFCRTAKSVQEYRQLLLTALRPHLDRDTLRKQALEFYYMHNLHADGDNIKLREGFVSIWKEAQLQTGSNENQMPGSLAAFRESAHYQRFADHLAQLHLDRTDGE